MANKNNYNNEHFPPLYAPTIAPFSARQPPSQPASSSALLPRPSKPAPTETILPLPTPPAQQVVVAPEPKLTLPTPVQPQATPFIPVQPQAVEPAIRSVSETPAHTTATTRPVNSQTTTHVPLHTSTTAPTPEKPPTREPPLDPPSAPKDKAKNKGGKHLVEGATAVATVGGLGLGIAETVLQNTNDDTKTTDPSSVADASDPCCDGWWEWCGGECCEC